jgi:spoIIIJ-associated protein
MTGFFSKLFGNNGKSNTSDSTKAVAMVEDTIGGVVERAGLALEFTATSSMNGEVEEVAVEFKGVDADLLKEENGELLESFQLFAKRVLQHKLPDARVEVIADVDGFREKATQSLIDLTDKLKDKCIQSGKSQYMRPLAPKDRKTVHQHLAGDDRVRSRSIGEGHFKKVKIYPSKQATREEVDDNFGNF